MQAEVLQKVLERVVHERMSQGKKVKGTHEKKKVKGWSTEEMKNKSRDDREEDTEEMIGWRSMSQGWRKRFWTSTRWRTAKEELIETEALFLEWRRVRRSRKYIIRKCGELFCKHFLSLCSENTTCSVCKACRRDSTEGEDMKRQQRMKVVKDMTKKIRSKGRCGCREPMVGC